MAITRAQIARELYKNGKRVGLKGGADMGTVDAKDSRGNVTRAATNKASDLKVGAGGASFNKDDNFQTLSTIDKDVRDRQKKNYEKQFYDKGQVPPLGSRPTSFKQKLDQRNKQKRLNYINRLIANRKNKISEGLLSLDNIPGVDLEETEDYFGFVPSVSDLVEQGFYSKDGRFAKGDIPDFQTTEIPGLAGLVLNKFKAPVTSDRLKELSKEIDTLEGLRTTEGLEGTNFNELMKTYEPNRFKLMNPETGGRDDDPILPIIPPVEDDTEEDTVTPVRNLGGLTARIGGSIFDFDGPQFAADGGRIGLKGGADAATESFSKSAGSSRPGRKGSVNVGAGGATFNPGGKDEGPDDRSTFEQTVNQRRIVNEAKKQKPSNLENMFKTASELNYLRNLIRMNPQGLGISYFTNKIGNFLFPPAGAAEFDMEAFQKAGAEKGFFGANDELEAMQKYFDFAQKQKAMGKDPAAIRDSANIGSALYGIDMDLVPETFLQTEEDFAKQKAPESFFAKGGIASLDREAFLLGGIAKGLKKAVRGVKKIAKSPIGKVALLAAGAGYGGFGPLKGLFSGVKGAGFLKSMAVNKSLLGTSDYFGGPTGILDLIKANPMKSIFAASALAGLATPKEDEDEFDIAKYYAQNQLQPSQSVRGMGSEFDFYGNQFVADGGRIGYQEGSKEPVAKKTLPLIDMDGMEKDYRETGGFVEMGRMEKADDVPARLSKNEFVFTADAVRNAGEGDIDKGAEVMYNMMKNLEAGGEVSEESQGLEGAREMFKTSQRLGEVL